MYPYTDDEVPGVISNLLANDEFVDLLGRFDSPRLASVAPWLVRKVARRRLAGLLGDVGSISQFQAIVEHYVARLIASSMASFEQTGIEFLDASKAYIFISNHRDIAGDSMLVDYALHRRGFPTVRIAVGDNLLQKQYATDLMRLNKGFFIKRSGGAPRAVYAALLESSRFIQESIRDGHSIWIAQAQGRAKDGIDRTDPAVIKMLTLADRKRPFTEVICSLSLVPVSLSYEYDPCDTLKARELAAVNAQGRYEKPAGEDLLSLVRGLTGEKGRVSLSFNRPLTGHYETPEAVAAALDQAVLGQLRIFPINYLALAALADREPGSEYESVYRQVKDQFSTGVSLPADATFSSRLAGVPAGDQAAWLRLYANPVLNKVSHNLPVCFEPSAQ
ncbi:MAG: 1-acyl-sn-glycerol-3-phosphate acyltransferase [Pseudomonadota bacterium]